MNSRFCHQGGLRIRMLASVIVALHILAGICVAQAQLETMARRFAEDFMSGSFQILEDQYTAEMKAAMPAEKAGQLHVSLKTGCG